jgi:hypothetical protein
MMVRFVNQDDDEVIPPQNFQERPWPGDKIAWQETYVVARGGGRYERREVGRVVQWILTLGVTPAAAESTEPELVAG